MENLEVSAKTVEEAIQQALKQLKLRREEVKITVLSEGKHGILGLGGEEARVRLEPLSTGEESDIGLLAKDILESLLDKMGVEASVTPNTEPLDEEDPGSALPIAFDVEGDDLGILIGRRGQTLSCLQFIVRLMVAHQKKSWFPIMIDVEGYRRRHYEALRSLARRMAEQVKAKGVPFTLEPMAAYERRIVHLVLANDPDVTTQSTGDGDARKVVIIPER